MGKFKGFAELREPHDLVKKLEYDFNRILTSPEDQYAAFDFFVTAEHIVDWIYPAPSDRKKRESMRSASSLLQITSHLANGVKHFEATSKHHRSVDDVFKSRYVDEGYVEDKYFDEPLIINFTDSEQQSFGDRCIEVKNFARQVLDYWQFNVPRKLSADT